MFIFSWNRKKDNKTHTHTQLSYIYLGEWITFINQFCKQWFLQPKRKTKFKCYHQNVSIHSKRHVFYIFCAMYFPLSIRRNIFRLHLIQSTIDFLGKQIRRCDKTMAHLCWVGATVLIDCFFFAEMGSSSKWIHRR